MWIPATNVKLSKSTLHNNVFLSNFRTYLLPLTLLQIIRRHSLRCPSPPPSLETLQRHSSQQQTLCESSCKPTFHRYFPSPQSPNMVNFLMLLALMTDDHFKSFFLSQQSHVENNFGVYTPFLVSITFQFPHSTAPGTGPNGGTPKLRGETPLPRGLVYSLPAPEQVCLV